MEKGIFNELKGKIRIGKKSHKLIAQFLLSYQGDFRKLKISYVAQETCTSAATIVRFAQSLGYLGFPEMKIDLQNQAKIYQGDDYSGENEIRQNIYLDLLNDSFKKTSEINTQAQILNFINKIKTAKNIDIYAKGETNVTAQDFALKLIRIGHMATAHQDNHTQHFIAGNSTKNTVGVGITFSGTSSDTLDNLKLAKEYGATTFLICKKGVKSPPYIDYTLNVSSSESGARVFSTVSRLTILFLLDTIYLELINTNPDFYHKKLNKTRIRGSR